MPRGPKKSIEEKIVDIDKKIAELIEEKKDLMDKKEQESKVELLKIIDKSGLSTEELLELIESKSKSK